MRDSDASLSAFLARVASGGALGPDDAAEAERLVRDDPVTDAFSALGVGLADGASERLTMFRSAAFLCPARQLDVAGHQLTVHLPPDELWRFYLPVCQAAARTALSTGAARIALSAGAARMQPSAGAARRLLVGIAGPGASGKSVFALLLRDVFNAAVAPGEGAGRAAICPLDGFHYPNAYLDSHFARDERGRQVPLRAFKGDPRSFDAESFARCLLALRAEPAVAVPRYDRVLHDPVPGGIQVGPSDHVVFVEGNYLLLDEPRWEPVAGLLDFTLFLVQSRDAALGALVERHVRGGRSLEDARAHVERVDRRNFEIIMSTAPRADLLVHRGAAQRIVGIEPSPRHARG